MRLQILMLSGTTPSSDLVAHFVEQLRALDADVWLAAMSDVERTHGDVPLTGARSLRAHTDGHGPEFHRRVDQATPVEQTWLHAEADDWVRDKADRADVLVAIDLTAIYAVWELASRNPYPAAVFGLNPALDAARERAGGRAGRASLGRRARGLVQVAQRRSRRTARRVIEAGAASALGRTSVAGGPAVRLIARRSRSLATRLAVGRIAGLEARGDLVAAQRSTDELLAGSSSNRRRANVLGSLAARHFGAGEPVPQLKAAVEAELAYADQLLSRGDHDGAAASYGQAVRLAFHRSQHLDSTWSPLADDPAGFTAAFRRSAVLGEINRPRGRLLPAAPPPDGRPLRILFATLGNTNFLGDITSRLETRDDVEVRMVVPLDLTPLNQLTSDPRKLTSSLLARDGWAERTAEKGLRAHLDWADVVFIDWCTQLVRVFQLVDPGTTRIIARLHSYEAFTPWPLTLDLSRLDQLIFVSEHVRDLVFAQRPELADSGVDTPVLTNGMDLQRLVRPKSTGARYTVAMIGYKVVAKDVLWAMEAIRVLRERDPRYRLLLIGGDFEEQLSPTAARYGAEFRRQAASLEAEGGLQRTGHLDDVADALVEAGTILCSSVREGSPVGVVEAVASGCVPVVRDWPFFAGNGRGARALYPAEWIVETPAEAAERLFRVTVDEDHWRSESLRCSAEVIARWDISVIGSAYDDLFGGTPIDSPAI